MKSSSATVLDKPADTNEPGALAAQPAVLTAQVSITRKATGVVEHYTLTGTPMPEQKD